MKKNNLILFFIIITNSAIGQSAPPHLKYFGYALVDALWDDPHDIAATTNYIAEVDSFSNIAQLGVYNYTDTIISRTNLMNIHCVKPFLSIQSVCYYEVDTLASSGHHFKLYPNFKARWNSFKSTNLSILHSSKIAAFYVADEPVWNGISFSELDTVCQMIKSDFPNIPLMFVEAYPVLNSLSVPTSVDWVGFDRYEIFDPTTSTLFLNNLNTLKSKLSTASQKIFLVIDDQWLPFYGAAGFTPDTIRYIVQNYYNLAASDTSIIGLIGYLWAGGLDDPGQLGVRDMPQSVINKNVEIGRMIKANNSPCKTTGLNENICSKINFLIFPNPATETLKISFRNNQKQQLEIYNFVGQLIKEVSIINSETINISDLQKGVYFIRLKDSPSQTLKFIKQN